jgi:hypothetical protein
MHDILAHVEAEESENVNGYWEKCKDGMVMLVDEVLSKEQHIKKEWCCDA